MTASKRKSLSPAAVAALNHRLRMIAERVEQRRDWKHKCDELARQTDEQRREIERVFPTETN